MHFLLLGVVVGDGGGCGACMCVCLHRICLSGFDVAEACSRGTASDADFFATQLSPLAASRSTEAPVQYVFLCLITLLLLHTL